MLMLYKSGEYIKIQMKIYVETYGCAANQADGEVIEGVLSSHGHVIAADPVDADVCVVNTCTVKTPTENKIKRRLRELEENDCRVVVAGCMPAAQENLVDEFPSFCFIGVNSENACDAVSAALVGERYVNVSAPSGKIKIQTIRHNHVVEILPISEGCLGSCNYCVTKLARGNLTSYRSGDIVRRVEKAVGDGVKEIWLTSQDTGAYGRDFGGDLAGLLNQVGGVSGDFMVRVGMMNPDHALAQLDELDAVLESEKIFKFAHIPVQSGDDGVLSDMGRKYNVKEFEKVVDCFRRKLGATISTDVICGYPTETEGAFENTLGLLERIKPDVLNVSRFWSRPKTRAAELKQLAGRVTKDRSRRAVRLFEGVGLKQNQKWVGWKGKALVSQKNEDGSYTGRNTHYKPIVIKHHQELLGKWVEVEIEEATYYDLRGRIIGV